MTSMSAFLLGLSSMPTIGNVIQDEAEESPPPPPPPPAKKKRGRKPRAPGSQEKPRRERKRKASDSPYVPRAPKRAKKDVAAQVTEGLDDVEGEHDAHLLPSESAVRLYNNFTPSQLARYEAYRRSAFGRPYVKKRMLSQSGIKGVKPPAVIVMAGITKVFVGEVIEEARRLRTRRLLSSAADGHAPLSPDDIREAYNHLIDTRCVPYRTKGQVPIFSFRR